MTFRTIPPKVLCVCIWRAVFFLLELFLFCSSTIILHSSASTHNPSAAVSDRPTTFGCGGYAWDLFCFIIIVIITLFAFLAVCSLTRRQPTPALVLAYHRHHSSHSPYPLPFFSMANRKVIVFVSMILPRHDTAPSSYPVNTRALI